jgi:hypothetical protein
LRKIQLILIEIVDRINIGSVSTGVIRAALFIIAWLALMACPFVIYYELVGRGLAK